MSCAALGRGKEGKESMGPLLNLVRGGLDRSHIVYDLFASVTTTKVSQTFEL